MKKFLLLMMLAAPIMVGAQQVEKLQKKVAKGDTEAMRELAAHYEAGYGLPVDTAKALELYRQADAAGNKDAKGDLSRLTLYYSALGHDSTECYRLAKASADAGSPYGTYRLAVCYQHGIGVQKDLKRFKELNEKAIAMGNEDALTLKGRLLLFGSTAYPHDVQQAFQCLKKVKGGTCHSSKYSLMADYYHLMGDEKSALKMLRKGVSYGEPLSALDLARYQGNGWGMPQDERAALAEFRRLKEKHHGDALFKMYEARVLAYAADTTLHDKAMALRLMEEVGDEPGYDNYDFIATSYIYGEFTPVDTAMAVRYWHRGVRKKDVSSIDNMCRYFQIKGNADSVDYYARMAYELESPRAAGHLATMAAEAGDMQAALRYALQGAAWGDEELRVAAGRTYFDMGNIDSTRQCFEMAVANGNNDAYVFLSGMARQIDGNEKQAVKYLEEGGRKGSSDCWLTLGSYYESLEKPNYRKAAECYEKAAVPQADYQLGRLCINGSLDTLPATLARGHQLLLRSAQAGSRDGMYALGYTYQQGIACEQNLDSALYWFRQLADQNDGVALMQLAIAYEHGRGVEPDTALAMQYYLRAGEAGISDGYAYLGDFYRNGTSTLKADSARAFELYQMAAAIEDDNAAGLYYVGDSYLRGIGVAKDTVTALPYFKEAATKGSYRSMGVIGDYFNYGWPGVTMDGDSALYYYFEASKGDDPRGDYMIGTWLFDQQAYEKSLEYIVSAANNGNPDAYVSYALAMTFGLGMEAKPTEGYSLLEALASNNKDGRAYRLLAIARFNGVGCEADTAMAVRYLDTAASLGNVDAMMALGNMYASGEGVAVDTVKTLEYYNRAVAAGSTKAMLRLAGSHQNGEAVPLDKKRAAELYQMAADRGSLDAMCRLGLCYEEGEGVILNSRKAYNLYMQAAERGSAYGMYLVGMCYVEGVYVKEDMEQAAQWFLKGAEAGSVRCCYIIGQMYAKGEGVKKSKKEAKKWLSVAAENGLEAAEQLLREL